MDYDYLVVGAGLTGASIARLLTDAGKKVLVIDRRKQLGGNIYDELHPCGMRQHLYGPHYFRTGSDKVWEFVNRFSEWYDFRATVRVQYKNLSRPWPITKEWLDREFGKSWPRGLKKINGLPRNLEERCLQLYPREVYDEIIKPYNVKQWGLEPKELLPGLCSRFAKRNERDGLTLSLKKYQGLPVYGYNRFIQNMLKDIPYVLENAHYKHLNGNPDHTIYSGPIDDYFGYRFGKLQYRAQNRVTWMTYFGLDSVQLNTPRKDGGIRTVDWRYIQESFDKTVDALLTEEFPYTPEDPDRYEYPVPTAGNQIRYHLYRELAGEQKSITFCGRLGTYQYLDMDVAIEQAMEIVDKLIRK